MRKVCRQCGVEQRIMDYYRTSAGGFMAICKACHRANVRENYRRNREHYREYERGRANLPHRVEAREQYAQTPEGKRRGSAAKRLYTERNPVKRTAVNAANNAIRDGRLTRQPCEVCGNDKAQAHHDDYSKPLDVRWLCTTHHAEWHKHHTALCPDQGKAA